MDKEVLRPAMKFSRTAMRVCASAGMFGILVSVLTPGSGCTAPRAELYGPNDASRLIPGIKKFNSQDRKEAASLVRDLDSEDPAVRLFAIHALQRMTGDRLGYLYYAEDEDRRPAVQRWKDWLEGKPLEPMNATTRPAAQSGTPVVSGAS
jgi:hypothetical protein